VFGGIEVSSALRFLYRMDIEVLRST